MSATPESSCAAPPARRSGGRCPDLPTGTCSTPPGRSAPTGPACPCESATPESGCASPPARRSTDVLLTCRRGPARPPRPLGPDRPGLLVRCRQLRSSAAPRLLRAVSAVVLLTCRRGSARPGRAARAAWVTRPAGHGGPSGPPGPRPARAKSATPESGCAARPARRLGGRSPDLPTWVCSTRPARAAWVTRPAGHGGPSGPPGPRPARAKSATPESGCAARPARRLGGRSPDLPTWVCSTRPARAAWVTRPAGHGGPSGPPGPRPARAKSTTQEFGCAAPPEGRFGGRSPELSTSTSEAPRSAAAERRTGVPDAARRSGTASTGTPVRTQEAR